MRDIKETTKRMIIADAKRLIEILEDPEIDLGDIWGGKGTERPETRHLMANIRRNTLKLDKEMYPR